MWPQVKQWSERLMRIDMIHRDGTQFSEFIDANMQFASVLGMIAPEKIEAAAKGCPMNDFLTVWLTEALPSLTVTTKLSAPLALAFGGGQGEEHHWQRASGLRQLSRHASSATRFSYLDKGPPTSGVGASFCVGEGRMTYTGDGSRDGVDAA